MSARSLLRSFALVTVIAVALITAAPAFAAPAVTVISPNGGEQFVSGSNTTVSWSLSAPAGSAIDSVSRLSSGLVERDDFTVDTLSNYTFILDTDPSSWSVANGVLTYTGINGRMARTGQTGVTAVTARFRIYDVSLGDAYLYLASATGDDGQNFQSYRLERDPIDQWSLDRLYANGYKINLFKSAVTPPTSNVYTHARIWKKGTAIKVNWGATLGTTKTVYNSDVPVDRVGFGFKTSPGGDVDWIEGRTTADVTMRGLPTGYKLQLVSGTKTVTAVESGGTAVANGSSLLFPLTAVRVLAADGSLQYELTAADYPDMGGGDVFQAVTATSSGFFRVYAENAAGAYELSSQPIPTASGQSTYNLAWTVTQPLGTDYRVRVDYEEGAGVVATDASDAVFSIVAPQPVVPKVTVTAPNGNVVRVYGTESSVRWSTSTAVSAGVFRVYLYNSTATYELTTEPVAAVDGQTAYRVPWTVSEPIAGGYKVRVTYEDGQGSVLASDVSDTVFSIVAPTVTVLAPNGGELYASGSSQTVSWKVNEALAIGSFRVYVYNGTSTWELTPQPMAAVGGQTNYSLAWNVTQPIGTKYKVRVSYYNVSGALVRSDTSNTRFSITL